MKINEPRFFSLGFFVYISLVNKLILTDITTMTNSNKWVIFDLDGTLALIDDRRVFSTKDNGKIDWDKFFDPTNIKMDMPNVPVITMAQTLKAQGFNIAIFSGRSSGTKNATIDWLNQFDVPFDSLTMRPLGSFTPDDILKSDWFSAKFPNKSDVLCIFDDRNKVVKMWRDKGIVCMHVADGDF